METHLILFIIVCIVFALCLSIFIAILVLPPQKVTTNPDPAIFPPQVGILSQGLQQSFDQGNGEIHVSDEARPLQLDALANGPVKPCFVYTRITDLSPPEVTGTSRGFTFYVLEPVAVIGLQVIDVLFAAGSRTVGIYNVSQRTLVCSSNVSKLTDQVVNGMRTRTLAINAQAILAANTLYACVAYVLPGDNYVLDTTFAFPPHEVVMDPLLDDLKLGAGYVGSVPSAALALPSNFLSTGPTSPFAGFQFQTKTKLFNSFAVDTQFGRMPPRYVYGLNVTTVDVETFTVGAGACSSIYDDANLLSPVPLTIVPAPATLVQDTWFAVYLADQTFADNVVEILLSPNWLEAPISQIPIDRMRRIGWLRTKPSSTQLYLMEQQGTGVARKTFYLESAVFYTLTTTPIAGDGTVLVFSLGLVPPTATSVRFQVHGEWGTPLTNAYSIDFDNATMTFYDQREQVQTITIPITQTVLAPQVTCTLHLPAGGANPITLEWSVLSFTEDL